MLLLAMRTRGVGIRDVDGVVGATVSIGVDYEAVAIGVLGVRVEDGVV